MKIIITGGAGFIGSNLVKKLAQNKDNEILVIDNLSSGKLEFIEEELKQPNVDFKKIDLLKDNLDDYFSGTEQVWHLSADPNVRTSATNINNVFAQNTTATNNVLNQVKKHKIKEFIFSSTSTIYGIAKTIPTKEDYGPLKPISIYGATKLSSEAMICAYASMFSFKTYIFRFANVVGPNSTHGVIYDFVNKLKKNPNQMEILGDGKQAKSYIHVSDCIEAMIHVVQNSKEKVNIFNVGTKEWTTTTKIADIVSGVMSLSPKYTYTGGSGGWKGDVPKMILDISALKKYGWRPKYSSNEAVKLTAQYLIK
ncbi:MAG: NAD-dependent epimerase/dehydratase family protein [Candidatus Aenigmarchaeota archaeon]|nr:NAD-dependent epimerase/dehydratase family protein [Candidatus Aenigmarchaeota archaeon]